VNIGFRWGNLREKGYLEDLRVDGNIKSMFKNWDAAWTGLI
jgi:hypothetical protein